MKRCVFQAKAPHLLGRDYALVVDLVMATPEEAIRRVKHDSPIWDELKILSISDTDEPESEYCTFRHITHTEIANHGGLLAAMHARTT